jgi:predicted DNA-binding protein
MEYSMTTSISLPLSLAQQLNRLAKKLRRGNDWIIVEALKEYLEKPNRYHSLAFEHVASRYWQAFIPTLMTHSGKKRVMTETGTISRGKK